MTLHQTYLNEIKNRLDKDRTPVLFVEAFLDLYHQYISGQTGLVENKDIYAPDPEKIFSYAKIANYHDIGYNQIKHLAIVRLNGGLATSMGLKQPKALLNIQSGTNFLDNMIQTVSKLRQQHQCHIPMVLMNSFATQAETIDYIAFFANLLLKDLPNVFVQCRMPRINAETKAPFSCPDDPDQEWYPPGHGDMYHAIMISGIAEYLLTLGVEYLFIANIDNLGATVDPAILGFMHDNNLPFLMEVTARTEQDKKGGHLALNSKGEFILRERAQCSADELNDFENISKYSFFNTNNLWIRLKTIVQYYHNKSFIKLPLIVNPKTIKTAHSCTDIVQLETAIGSGITELKGIPLIVPRSRFKPIKYWEDLISERIKNKK